MRINEELERLRVADVDATALRRFLAVAENQSFRRAAVQLALAQPALSRSIRDLECALGTPLFVRSTRRVELTAAGRVLRDEAPAVLAHLASALHRTVRAAAREPRLAIAAKAGTPHLAEIVRRYQLDARAPRASIAIGGWGEPETMLADGRAEVAFVRRPSDASRFAHVVLAVEPRVVALPRGHRLARRRAVRRADLAGEPVPVWPPASPEIAAFRAGVATIAELAAVPAGPPVHDLGQLLEAVALGQGVAFLPRSYTLRGHPSVVFVAVRDIAPSTSCLAWPTAGLHPAIERFVQIATDVTRAAA